MEKNLIISATAYIEDLFKGASDGHDAAHSVRVYNNAVHLAEWEGN